MSKPKLSPQEKRLLYNLKNVLGLNTYVKCEQFFKTLKFRDKIWIHDDLLLLGQQGYKVIGIEPITIPAIHANVIAAIGPVATRITLDHISIDGSFIKDVISYNILDGLLYVSIKKPH